MSALEVIQADYFLRNSVDTSVNYAKHASFMYDINYFWSS